LKINNISIGILAGGKGTRMQNQDKGLVEIQGITLVKNILNKISPHTSNILINANRNITLYEEYGYPVIQDIFEDFQGPLSGVYSMLNNISTEYLLTIPCDCPNFNWLLVQEMVKEIDLKHEVYVANNGVRSQPVFMLISKSKISSLKAFLSIGGRKIDKWYKENNYKYVYFDKNVNYFENINTLEQLNDYNK
tara:strand:- start:97 stop:675 length:579 start_codon:yes stop_codon:yes gene_type:complete